MNEIRDARPPRWLLAVLNPAMRAMLRTPLARWMPSLALLDFRTRRTGRRLLVPVGWHHVDGADVVVTPATWRANFAGGHRASVVTRGRRTDLIGRLDTDPEAVVAVLHAVVAARGSLRSVAIHAERGQVVDADDVRKLDRALIRFESASDAADGVRRDR